MKKSKVKGAWLSRSLNLAIGAACLAVTAGGLSAAPIVLWNNGAVNPTLSAANPADSNNSGYTVFDSFTVPAVGWIVTGFDITDFFVNTPIANYRSTNWSIWNGNPLTTGTLVASAINAVGTGLAGSTVGTCGSSTSPSTCYATITVTLGTPVVLGAGTFWLGTINNLANAADETTHVFSAGNASSPNNGWEESNGAIVGSLWKISGTPQGCSVTPQNFCSGTGDVAFDIIGNLAPEPGTLVLMSLALVGLGFKARRRTA